MSNVAYKTINLVLLLLSLTSVSAWGNNALSSLPANPEMEKISNSLCITLVNANVTGKDIVKNLEDEILTHLNVRRDSADHKMVSLKPLLITLNGLLASQKLLIGMSCVILKI